MSLTAAVRPQFATQVYTVGHKTWQLTFVHIFANCRPILKISSQAHSAENF